MTMKEYKNISSKIYDLNFSINEASARVHDLEELVKDVSNKKSPIERISIDFTYNGSGRHCYWTSETDNLTKSIIDNIKLEISKNKQVIENSTKELNSLLAKLKMEK